MSSSNRRRMKSVFQVEIERGFSFKVLVDILAGTLERTIFRITDDGITIIDADSKRHIMFVVFLDRSKLKKFKCSKPIDFSVNLKHFQGLIKNVKKKDMIRLSIMSHTLNQLDILIRSSATTSTEGKPKELFNINIQLEKEAPPPLTIPEYLMKGDTQVKIYEHPFVISSSTFQKVKKMTKMGKITVSIFNSDFIEFSYQNGLYGGKVQDGDFPENSDDSESSNEENSEWFIEDFNSEHFDYLVKLPGLSNNIRFFAPRVDKYPLKISCDVGNFGEILIYIKDQKQIEFETTIKEGENDEIIIGHNMRFKENLSEEEFVDSE